MRVSSALTFSGELNVNVPNSQEESHVEESLWGSNLMEQPKSRMATRKSHREMIGSEATASMSTVLSWLNAKLVMDTS
jgi:flagellar basal body P-ring protein FlgI